MVGASWLRRGDYVEAERYLVPSYTSLDAALGERDPHTRLALGRLIAMYGAAQMPAQAAVYRARLAEDTVRASSRAERLMPAVPSRRGSAGDRDDDVAVLPFRVTSAEPGMSDIRDWIQDLVSERLAGEGGLRIVDAGTSWQLHGDIAGSPQRLSLEATLVAAPAGAIRGRVSVEGSADSLPYLADRIARDVLAFHAARDSNERAAFTGTSLAGLRAFLAGRAAAHRGAAATMHYERALALDSSLIPAVVALAADADVRRGDSRPGERWQFDAVWPRRERLSPADRAQLTAHLGPRYPRPSTLAERIAAAEQAAKVAPDRAETWFTLGDHLERFGSLISYPGWKARGAEAYRRALALDSTDANTLDRLLVLAADAGDEAQLRRYAASYFARYADAESAGFLRWATALALGDSMAVAKLRLEVTGMPEMSLLRIVLWSDRRGLGLEDARRAASVLVDRADGMRARRIATNRMVPTLLNHGRPGEAKRLLAESETGFGMQLGVGSLDFRIYAALYWNGDTSDASAAAERLESYLRGAPLRPSEARDRRSAACALAHWRLAAGDLDRAHEALERAPRLRAPATPAEAVATPVCVAAAAALLARARGRPYATDLARLDSLLLAAWNTRDLLLTVGNLVAARLYEASGDLAQALERVRRRAGWEAFLSTQLLEEGRLAALSGDRDGAVRAYRHNLALRSDPEATLRADAAWVRAELGRLDPGGGDPKARRPGVP